MDRRFSDLVDLERFAALMRSVYEATGIPFRLVDRWGAVLCGFGWQDVCAQFHRAQPDTAARCADSDRDLLARIMEGGFVGHRCANGLMDYAAPVTIAGEHMATMVLGQFFHEPPDLQAFRRQAAEFGFDEGRYLAALARVPVIPEDKAKAAMAFFVQAAGMLGEAGALAERHYQATFEQAAIGLVHTGFDGRLLRFNRKACDLLGYEPAELAGLTWQDITHPDDVEAVTACVRRLVAGEVPSVQMEKRSLRKGGGSMWMRISCSVQRGRDGRPLHVITAVEDVDDRKRTDALLEARVRLAALSASHSLNDLLVATLDEACALTAAEIGFFHFLQEDGATLSLQAWSSRTTREFCQADGAGLHYDVAKAGIWADALRQRRPVVVNDYAAAPGRKGLPDGHAHLSRLVSVPIQRAGRVVALIGVGNKRTDFGPKDVRVVETLADLAWDLAERKRAEEALAERSRLVQQRNEALRVLSEIAALPPRGAGLLREALATAGRHLGLPIGLVSRVEGDQYTVMHHWAPEEAGFFDGQTFPLGDTYCAAALGLGDVLAIAHAGRSDFAAHPCYRATGLEAYVGAPLRVGGRLFGTLAFCAPGPARRDFDEGDREFVRLLARWVGGVLERQQAEAEIISANARLSREAARYQLLLRTACDGIHIMDQTGRLVEANDAFRESLGYGVGEMDGFSIGDWDDHFSEEAIAQRIQSLASGPERFESRHRRKDGRVIDVEVNARRLVLEGRTYVYASSRDVTRRKALEEELRRSNEELEQFAYVASHDLREPLRMIASYLSVLDRRMGRDLDDDCRRFLGYATDGAKRMDALIRDLLEYSRIGRGGRAMEVVRLGDLAGEAVDNLGVAISKAKAEIEVGQLPDVVGDPVELVRLFQNLIGNAVKYRHADRPPRVAVSARPDGGNWTVSVADNGIGIPPDLRQRIFAVFQRLHSREEYEGTGIGLAACKKIVEHHGGRIWVDGAPDGEGSVFRFSLPRAPVG